MSFSPELCLSGTRAQCASRAIVYSRLLARGMQMASRFYGQARSPEVTRKELGLSGLPAAFDGLTIAFLTDFHCSAQTPPSFLERIVRATNRLEPQLILLGGDYITRGAAYLEPIQQLLGQLQAPLGKFGVLGNHDFETDIGAVRDMLAHAGITDLTNHNRFLTRQGERLYLAGVGDLWRDTPDLAAALAGVGADAAVILLSHNPHFAERITDPRVRLVLAGHTHGGQVQPPRAGAWYANSRLGRFFVIGEVRHPTFVLYVSRGLGTVVVPFRYNCPPEITYLTLRTAD